MGHSLKGGWAATPWKFDSSDHVQIRLLVAGESIPQNVLVRFSGNGQGDKSVK